MKKIEKLDVFFHDRKVGTMALYQRQLATFEYDGSWLADGFSISPFSLPLEKKVFIPKIDPFDGIFGVFNDSLPDGWGRLLVDRLMRKKGINPQSLGNLDRLAIVGQSGMGALTYRPVISTGIFDNKLTLDEIAMECRAILNSMDSNNLDILFMNGGSSGGARPKILTKVEKEEWIIKFPSSEDGTDIGKQEYDYALCAKECGIEMEKVRLFPSEKCEGYFGTRRFDRKGNQIEDRVHMVTVSGLLETSHRIPNLDYNSLMKLTLILTKSMDECMKMYRLMCFNVFAHNRDDHSKNFTYLYNDTEKRWVLSPAYDLTYSSSIGGEHATTVNGNGSSPGLKELLSVAEQIGLDKRKAKQITADISDCVMSRLHRYLQSGSCNDRNSKIM